jgi:hypothetical protein
LRKPERRFYPQESQWQSAQSDDAGNQQRISDFGIVRLFGQQPVKVKRERNGREQKKEGHVPELIKSQEQEEPGKQPWFYRTGTSRIAQLERDEY